MKISEWMEKIKTARQSSQPSWESHVENVYHRYHQLHKNSLDLENRSRHWRQYLRNSSGIEESS